MFIQKVVRFLPLKNQLLHRAGIQARALIYFYVLFTRAAIQTGPKSRSGGKTSIYGMFSIFTLAIEFDCLVLAIFQSFYLIVIFNFDKLSPTP